MHGCIYECMDVYMNAWMYIRMYGCIYECMDVYMNVWMYI